MSKIPLTPQQKLEKKQRDNLKLLHNRVLSAFSFHEIQTWKDVAKHLGQPGMFDNGAAPSNTLTYQELKEFLNKQTEALEERLRHAHERPVEQAPSPVQTEPIAEPKTEIISTPEIQSQPVFIPKDISPIPTERPVQESEPTLPPADSYKLVHSPNENVFHYWFQKKAISEMMHKLLVEKRRGLLVISTTGSGKTFMLYGLLRRLEDMQYHVGKTFSHIPWLYVTRATVVEQTERVGKKCYNMGVEQMEVINIEQLRSKAGRLWVTEKMQIVNGEEEWIWEWKKGINPVGIGWDECQALKNEGSYFLILPSTSYRITYC